MVAMVTRTGHMTLQQVIEKVDSTYPDIIPPIRCVMYLVHKAVLLGLAIHHLKRLYTATQGGVVELPERTVADLRRWQAVETGCVDVMRECERMCQRDEGFRTWFDFQDKSLDRINWN